VGKVFEVTSRISKILSSMESIALFIPCAIFKFGRPSSDKIKLAQPKMVFAFLRFTNENNKTSDMFWQTNFTTVDLSAPLLP